MSARMAGTLPAPALDSIDVHEWLARVEDDIDFANHGTTPLATVCAAAVDPLEIAVALEVAGVSHAVATGRYNRADVFSIAQTLWTRIPLRPVPTAAVVLPRAGNRSDLARGLLIGIRLLITQNRPDGKIPSTPGSSIEKIGTSIRFLS